MLNDLKQVSVVIPVVNDSSALEGLLSALAPFRELEIVVVDGGSDDCSIDDPQPPVRLLKTECGRALQLNAGIASTQRPWLWFLHADSVVTRPVVEALQLALTGAQWGRFDVSLSGVTPGLRLIAAAMNQRSAMTSICTGDQGIFVRRTLLHRIGGIPDQPLMEDVELSKRLRRIAKPTRIRTLLGTSPRRWEKDGIVRTVLLMWELRLRYFLGASPEALAARYYPDRRWM
ncbi:MAG: TIGR04283 family arsenosugar biosynthesis glycosyltransferase [Pseudomonadales bacterium]